MTNTTFFFVILLFATPYNMVSAQKLEAVPPATQSEFQKNYEERIKQAKLSGQYIPKDIFDAFSELTRLTDTTSRLRFKSATEYEVEHTLYFSLGRWICTNWGLYEGSRIGQYLRESGVSFPEDQAITILICWHRKLNGKDIGFKQVKERFAAKRKKEREDRIKKMPVIKEEIKKPTTNTVKTN